MQDFTYHAPSSLEDALGLLSEDPAATRLLAGGTDLVLQMERGGIEAKRLVDLKGIPELTGIRENENGGYTVGALTCAADVMTHAGLAADAAAFVQAAGFIGGPPIRNRATIGGNICNASPAADTSTPLLALGARAVVANGATGSRKIPLDEFWTGPRQTVLQADDILAAIELPAVNGRSGSDFQRLTRTAMDIALVNAAAFAVLDANGLIEQAALSLGAVAPTVIGVPDVLTQLKGLAWSTELAAEVTRLAEQAAQPIDDVRASAEYRRITVGVLAARAMAGAVAKASANGNPSA